MKGQISYVVDKNGRVYFPSEKLGQKVIFKFEDKIFKKLIIAGTWGGYIYINKKSFGKKIEVIDYL